MQCGWDLFVKLEQNPSSEQDGETQHPSPAILPNRLLSALLLRSNPLPKLTNIQNVTSCNLSNNVTTEKQNADLSFPIHPKVLAEVRDAALKYKEGNPVWADTCNNLAKSAELFLSGYGPCEDYFKYSKPEVLDL